MKKYTLLLYGLIIPTLIPAQTFCLKNEKDNSVISFAHVKHKNKNMGTYSGKNGCFKVDDLSSVSISHIGFKDTLINLKNSQPIIYLSPKKYILNEVIISENRKVKVIPSKKFKQSNDFLNVSSYEIGTIVLNDLSEDFIIKNVRIPIKFGVDLPVLKINIYAFDLINHKPSKLLYSSSYQSNNKKDNYITADFEKDRIYFEKEDSYFISIELVGYDQKKGLVFKKYKNYKDALRLKIRKIKKELCFIRVKNKSLEWHPISFFWKVLKFYEPSIYLELQ